MEKLYSATKKKGGNYGKNVKQPTHKIFSLAIKGYENILPGTPEKKHFNQPYSGCFILVNRYQDYYLKPVNQIQDETRKHRRTFQA